MSRFGDLDCGGLAKLVFLFEPTKCLSKIFYYLIDSFWKCVVSTSWTFNLFANCRSLWELYLPWMNSFSLFLASSSIVCKAISANAFFIGFSPCSFANKSILSEDIFSLLCLFKAGMYLFFSGDLFDEFITNYFPFLIGESLVSILPCLMYLFGFLWYMPEGDLLPLNYKLCWNVKRSDLWGSLCFVLSLNWWYCDLSCESVVLSSELGVISWCSCFLMLVKSLTMDVSCFCFYYGPSIII